MTTISLTLQNVNGDPFVSGGNINITTGTTAGAVFFEDGVVSLSTVATNDTVTIGGLVYNYDYLGSHNVRGDPTEPAAYFRIVGPLPAGATITVGSTFAIDLSGQPGDIDYPDLSNGNTKGSVAELDTTTEIGFPGAVCFALGTRVSTPGGWRLVQSLKSGDLVDTSDHGPLPVWFVTRSQHHWSSDPHKDKPICIKRGALGSELPHNDLCLSPQHRVLLRNSVSGEEVLAAAKALTKLPGVRQKNGARATAYFHIILKRHAILNAEGILAESFYPGEQALKSLPSLQRAAIHKLIFADAEREASSAFMPARPFVKVQQARQFLAKTSHAVGKQVLVCELSDQLSRKLVQCV